MADCGPEAGMTYEVGSFTESGLRNLSLKCVALRGKGSNMQGKLEDILANSSTFLRNSPIPVKKVFSKSGLQRIGVKHAIMLRPSCGVAKKKGIPF